MATYYEKLGVSPDASAEKIQKAYRSLAPAYHPDKSKHPNAEQMMKELNEAYETLRDPTKRAAYDRKLSLEGVRMSAERTSYSPPEPPRSSPPPPPPPSNGPKIKITPSLLDFGTITKGKTATREFLIHNSGGPFYTLQVYWEGEPNWGGVQYDGSKKNVQTIRVKVEIRSTKMLPGQYVSSIIVIVDGKTYVLPVSFTVTETTWSMQRYTPPPPPEKRKPWKAPKGKPKPWRTRIQRINWGNPYYLRDGFWYGVATVVFFVLWWYIGTVEFETTIAGILIKHESLAETLMDQVNTRDAFVSVIFLIIFPLWMFFGAFIGVIGWIIPLIFAVATIYHLVAAIGQFLYAVCQGLGETALYIAESMVATFS